MAMNKIQDVKLETTATYQPLSDLNVRFWSQDKNTAELRFIITRNKFPLSLSKENVKVIIALESGTSFISSDDFIIDSEVEGVARYIIPTDFMRVATNVTGQVYVTTLDREEVIVERQFKFTVSNDLLSDYPSEDKLRYIKTFDDLRTEISSRVSKLESDMETMEDYVTQVQDTTQEGITALSTLIQQKQDAYNANHTAKMKELNDKGTEYSTKFDEDKQYIDEKSQAFKDAVNGSGLITTGQSKDWQKYKLTDDDGKVQYFKKGTISNVLDLPTGIYETVSNDDATTQGLPANNTYVQIKVLQMANNEERKIIEVTSTYNSKKWDRQLHTNGDRDTGWREVAYINPNNPFETVQESQNKANEAETNAKTYTDEKVFNLHKTLFEGTANGVDSTIPLSETLDNFIFLYIYGKFDGGYFAETGDPNGTSDIVIDRTNVIGTDGASATVFECVIQKMSRTQLKIVSDTYHGIHSGNGSGPNANRFTITKIVGVRKYADTTQPV